MTTTTPRPLELELADLRDRLTGTLVLPGDPGYAEQALPWNVAVPSAPAAVVRAVGADDVRAAVRFAADHGLTVDVRATGHGAAPTDGATLLVHTAGLDELHVHPEGWARVGAGVRWAQVIDAAAEHGLAPLCGSSPGVGVVGFLTGGGVNLLARRYGLSSDHVRAFDVVTGDGELRRASAEENPALFWGLRGGKGALGIVTAVEFDLVPLPTIYAGCLYFDGADADTVLHAWREWTTTLPVEATTSVAVLRLPPMPSVPEPLAGKVTVAVRFTWTGDAEAGAAVLAPMQAVAPVILGGAGVMPYREIGSVHADPVDPMPVSESCQLLHSLTPTTVDALIAMAGPDAACPQVIVELRHLGGAVADNTDDAVSHRSAAFVLLTIGIGVPPVVEGTVAHAAQLAAALAPWATGGRLPNFGGAIDVDGARRTYDPATLQRLASLAAAYDPRGVLTGARAVRAASDMPA